MRLSVRSSVTTYDLTRIRSAVLRIAAMSAIAALLTGIASSATRAQGVGVGASVTPYAGYLVTGKWYDGPLGTNLSTTNAPVVGAQIGVPISRGVSLVGNVAYASGDLRIGLPIVGGVNVGTNKMWFYDGGIELGGLAGKRIGMAPYVQGGVGGVTNDLKNALFTTKATNLVYTAGVGLDVGLSRGFSLRVQAKDYIGRFDSQEAVGFRAEGNLAHNWALSAGVKLAF